ncbi:MAG: hypothetical protein OXC94_10950 [Chloroflexi bacterium]|nr:hypothetical protein [Chloroflexota bacterium]
MTIWVGRYAMVEGEPRDESPWLIDRRRVVRGESVRLVVLAEPADERSEPYCAEVADAVAGLFGRDSLSLTGGLLRALRQTHANLVEWNRHSLLEHRIAVGVTCVAIRDGEATVALAGRGSVYRGDPSGVERLGSEEAPGRHPLGGEEPVEPLFLSAALDDSWILLITSSAEAAAGKPAVAKAVSAGPERALGDLYALTRGVRDMSAVLLADVDTEEEEVAPIGVPAGEITGEIAGPVRPTLDSGSRGADAPRGRGGFPTVRTSERDIGPRRSSARLPWGLIGAVSAAVIATALFAGLILLPLLADDQERRITDLLEQASSELSRAEQARGDGDRAEERAAIEEARSILERARAQAEDDPRVDDLLATMEAARSRLDAVIAVSALDRVSALDGIITAPAQAKDLVSGGGMLWLLEQGSGRIARLDPDGALQAVRVYSPDETYDGARARAADAIAWDEAGRRLLVLDESRSLFEIRETRSSRPRRLLLRGADDIRSVQGIAAYSGNLYVLDPAGGEIWRYVPAGDGFDSERQGLLGTAEIGTARAIAVDGDVYLLGEDTLRRFRLGAELDPLLAGIDAFPGAASGIVADPERGVIYVGDRERGRIVVTERGGNFLRQYHHVDFDDMRALALGPDGDRLYVLTGRSIFGFDPLAEAESLPGAPAEN